MALVHRLDEDISAVQRFSDNLREVKRGERNHIDAVLRYQHGRRNTFEKIPDGPGTSDMCSEEVQDRYEFENRKA